jgi:hypothetical protein
VGTVSGADRELGGGDGRQYRTLLEAMRRSVSICRVDPWYAGVKGRGRRGEGLGCCSQLLSPRDFDIAGVNFVPIH